MDEQTREDLWEELRLLQPIIDKFDDFTFRIKNWFITIFVAVVGFSIIENKPNLLLVSLFLILAFYFYEVTYRAAHGAFLKRNREVQRFLRENAQVSNDDKAPHLDRYLIAEAATDSRVFRFYFKLVADVESAKKNVVAMDHIRSELINMLFQLRVSFIYVSTFILNILLALLLRSWMTLIASLIIAATIYVETKSRGVFSGVI